MNGVAMAKIGMNGKVVDAISTGSGGRIDWWQPLRTLSLPVMLLHEQQRAPGGIGMTVPDLFTGAGRIIIRG